MKLKRGVRWANERDRRCALLQHALEITLRPGWCGQSSKQDPQHTGLLPIRGFCRRPGPRGEGGRVVVGCWSYKRQASRAVKDCISVGINPSITPAWPYPRPCPSE